MTPFRQHLRLHSDGSVGVEDTAPPDVREDLVAAIDAQHRLIGVLGAAFDHHGKDIVSLPWWRILIAGVWGTPTVMTNDLPPLADQKAVRPLIYPPTRCRWHCAVGKEGRLPERVAVLAYPDAPSLLSPEAILVFDQDGKVAHSTFPVGKTEWAAGFRSLGTLCRRLLPIVVAPHYEENKNAAVGQAARRIIAEEV